MDVKKRSTDKYDDKRLRECCVTGAYFFRTLLIKNWLSVCADSLVRHAAQAEFSMRPSRVSFSTQSFTL